MATAVCGPSSRIIPMASAGGRQSASSGCCAFTFSSNGMPWLTKRSKMHSMTARRCALLPASTLSVEAVPDATTLLKFRHLLEAHDLTQRIFAEVGALLRERKLLMKEGTIVDATIIAAPSSTKNLARERDPEMHQTRKANQWYFGMKAHLGVDAHSGLVHTLTGTAANVADIAQTHALLHGEEKEVYADAGYLGVEKREEIATCSPAATWYVAAKRGQVKALAEGLVKELAVQFERRKAQVRARVEHPFHTSRTSFDIARRATGDWPGTPRSYIASLLWRTSLSPAIGCWAAPQRRGD